MIREMSVYRCICSKCGHSWITKTHELPANCAGAKCRTKLWNGDYTPEIVPTVQPLPVQLATETQLAKFDGVQMNDAMAKFLTKAVVEAPVEDVPDVEDWRFTADRPQYETPDDVYRKQFLGKRVRTVKVDADDLENILRVM